MCKAICGVAAGACNGAINLHWAKGSDISDINAKFGAQHTVTGSLGLIFAALFARSVSTTPSVILWSLYTLLTLMHIFGNIKCLRLIAFDYLNTIRLNMVVDGFLELEQEKDVGKVQSLSKEGKKVIQFETPVQISKRESLFFQFIPLFQQKLRIRSGSPFQRIYQSINAIDYDEETSLLNFYIGQLSRDNYCVVCGTSHNFEINIGFAPDIDNIVKTKAYFTACIVRSHLIQLNKNERKSLISNTSALNQFYTDIEGRVKVLWPRFVNSVSSVGWDLNKSELDTEGYCLYLKCFK